MSTGKTISRTSVDKSRHFLLAPNTELYNIILQGNINQFWESRMKRVWRAELIDIMGKHSMHSGRVSPQSSASSAHEIHNLHSSSKISEIAV
jgi:hypothetical protein